jgi:hypothetical protein
MEPKEILEEHLYKESSMTAVLKEPGHKKSKKQVLIDVVGSWSRSDDKCINNLSRVVPNFIHISLLFNSHFIVS